MLDDNKKLCLSTGEIIRLTSSMTMIFEVEDLQHASPATISRCGMIFLEPNIVGWDALIRAYANFKLPQAIQKFSNWIYEYLRQIADLGTAFIRKHGKYPFFSPSEMILVNSVISFFDCFLYEFKDSDKKNWGVEASAAEEIMRNSMIFSMIWGFGCSLEEISRAKFNTFLVDLFNGREVLEKYSLSLIFPENFKNKQFISLKLAEEKNLFDIGFDRMKARWLRWTDYLEQYSVFKIFSNIISP